MLKNRISFDNALSYVLRIPTRFEDVTSNETLLIPNESRKRKQVQHTNILTQKKIRRIYFSSNKNEQERNGEKKIGVNTKKMSNGKLFCPFSIR